MSLFYLCTEINCNRKYKTEIKLVDHLLKQQKIVENNRNNYKKIEERHKLISNIEKTKNNWKKKP